MTNVLSTVLFICTGNVYRSRFAEAVFNQRAEVLGIPGRAFSRGILAAAGYTGISPITALAMKERRIARWHTAAAPAALQEEDFESADRFIAMYDVEHRPMITERFPNWAKRVVYWDIGDVEDEPPATALSKIEQRTAALLDEIRERVVRG